jgi:hypothetical protein
VWGDVESVNELQNHCAMHLSCVLQSGCRDCCGIPGWMYSVPPDDATGCWAGVVLVCLSTGWNAAHRCTALYAVRIAHGLSPTFCWHQAAGWLLPSRVVTCVLVYLCCSTFVTISRKSVHTSSLVCVVACLSRREAPVKFCPTSIGPSGHLECPVEHENVLRRQDKRENGRRSSRPCAGQPHS